MRPSISEFSYGFALVNEFIHWAGQNITAVPVYPSLIEEAALGYDVLLDRAGVPLFLQFKLSHCMVRSSAMEVRQRVLTKPFYRMHLYARNESRQHERLMALEALGNEVYYAAPEFHRHQQLNAAYLQRQVIAQSWFFRPSTIGAIPDDGRPHHVAFKAGEDHGWFCSKPVRMKPDLKGHALVGRLTKSLRQKGEKALSKDGVLQLTENILANLAKERAMPARHLAQLREQTGVLARLAHIAQAVYGAQLLVVQSKPEQPATPTRAAEPRE